MSTSIVPTADELAQLVQSATYAPSVHNTQPWHFDATADGLRLRMDGSRRLAVLDPYSRELLMSCGAALHHLTVAARGLGLDTEMVIEAGVGTSSELTADAGDVVATARFTRGTRASADDLAAGEAILSRHTHRGRFADEQVPAALLNRLSAAVRLEGAMLRVVGADELTAVEVLVSGAEQTLLDTPGYRDELAQWVWTGDEHAERVDGLPAHAVASGEGRAQSLQGRQWDGLVAPRPVEPPVPERPTVVLLTTAADEPADWVQAGRAMSALLLAATGLEILAQPIGQVVDVPATRWALQRSLGVVGAPQMLLRLGFGAPVPPSPRRPVADVYTPRAPVG